MEYHLVLHCVSGTILINKMVSNGSLRHVYDLFIHDSPGNFSILFLLHFRPGKFILTVF